MEFTVTKSLNGFGKYGPTHDFPQCSLKSWADEIYDNEDKEFGKGAPAHGSLQSSIKTWASGYLP